MTAAILPYISDLGKNSSSVWSSGQITRRCLALSSFARQIRYAELRPADVEAAVSLLELLTRLPCSLSRPLPRMQPRLSSPTPWICQVIQQLREFRLANLPRIAIWALVS